MSDSAAIDRQVTILLDNEDWAGIRRLLDDGTLEPNRPVTHLSTGDRFTLLSSAITKGWTDLALYLIAHRADPNARTMRQTPLMFACGAGSQPIISALIEAGAVLDVKSPAGEGENGETALTISAGRGDLWAVRRLLEAGAKPGITVGRSRTALHAAVTPRMQPDTPAIMRELISKGCPVDGTELHSPVYRREVASVAALLRGGAPPNALIPYSDAYGAKKGETPLTTAAASNPNDWMEELGPEFDTLERRRNIIRLLLEHGAEVDLSNAKGWTPLMLAVLEKQMTLVETLLAAGADPGYLPPGSKGLPPLALARKAGFSAFLERIGEGLESGRS